MGEGTRVIGSSSEASSSVPASDAVGEGGAGAFEVDAMGTRVTLVGVRAGEVESTEVAGDGGRTVLEVEAMGW